MSIPAGTRFHGVHQPVDTVNKGSALANSLRETYTIEQIRAGTGGDTYTLQADAKTGSSVPLKLDAAAGSDSTVNLTEGTGITLTQNSATEITIASAAVSSGPTYPFKTITNTYTILGTDCVIVFDFPSLKVVTLPLAASYPGKVLILRGEDGSDTCRLTRSGSDKVNDDSGNQNYIEINANKARTLVSDGVDTWYCVTGLGS